MILHVELSKSFRVTFFCFESDVDLSGFSTTIEAGSLAPGRMYQFQVVVQDRNNTDANDDYIQELSAEYLVEVGFKRSPKVNIFKNCLNLETQKSNFNVMPIIDRFGRE